MRPTWSSCHIASLIRADDFPCKCDAASLARDTCAANFDGSLGSRRCRVGSTTDLSVSRQVFDAFVPVQFNLTPLSVSSHPLKNLCVKMIRRKEKRIFHISSPSSLWRILDFYLESNFRNRSRDRSLMPSCPSSLILPPQCLISLPKNLCVKMIRRKKEYTSPSSSWRIDFGLTFISNQIFENKR